MERLPRMTYVEARPGYVLYVEFDDGVSGEVSVAHRLWGPMFEPLKDPDFFAQVTLDGGAPTWPNQADLAPDAIHTNLLAAFASAV